MESFFPMKIVQSMFVIVLKYVIISSSATRNFNYFLSFISNERNSINKQSQRALKQIAQLIGL